MVLLVNVVCALIFCMICHFSNGIAEKDSENVMCPKKACQEVSNPFDITRNDAVNGLKGSGTHETHPGDMFHDIGGSENIKKISEVHDNGYYTSLCWIEITTITELQNGSKSAIREYAITFETPSDIPEKYISKTNDLPDGETTQYTLFDRDTKKSEVVNFTTISKSNDSTVRQNRKILCGSGPVFTKEFMEWPHSDRKRVEIRVSPKRQTLVASDCLELSDNVEKISTLSPTRRDFDGTDTELLTGEGSDGTPTLNYPTSDSPNETTSEYNKVQPSHFDSDRAKEIKPIEYSVGSTKTTIESVSSSPVVYESSAEPQVQYEGLKSGNLKPNKTFPFVPKLQQHPENSNNFNRTHPTLIKSPINVTIPLKSVTKVSTTKQPGGKGNKLLEATKKLIPDNVLYITATTPGLDIALQNRTTGILNDEDLTPTDFRPVKVENETERDSNMHFTKLPPHEQTSSVTKDTSQLSEDSGATETLIDIDLTEAPTKVLPLHKTPTNVVNASFSDKDPNTKLKNYNLDNKTPITELSMKDLDYTPYDDKATTTEDFRETVHTKRPSEHSPATNKYDKNVTSQNKPKLKLPKTTQQPPGLSKEVSNLPITESNVLKAEDYRIPQTVNDISDSVLNKTSTPISTTVTHGELPTKNTPVAKKDDTQTFPKKEVKWMPSQTSKKPQESSALQTEVSNLPNTEHIVEVEKTSRLPQILKGTPVPNANKTSTPLSTSVSHLELPIEYTAITTEGDTRAFAKKTPKGMSSKTSERPQKSFLIPTNVSNLPNIERTVEVEKSTRVPHILEDVSIPAANKTSTPLSAPVTHWKLPMEFTQISANHGTNVFAEKTPKGMSSKSSEEPQKSSLLPTKVSNLPSTERAVEVEKTTNVSHILKDISIPVRKKTSTTLSTPVTHWELPMEYTPISAEGDTRAFAKKTPQGMSSNNYEEPQKSSLLPTKVSNLPSTERTIEVEKTTGVPHILKGISIPVRKKTSTTLSTPVTHWELPIEYTPITAKNDTRAFTKKTPKGMSSKTYEKLQKSSLLPTKVSDLPSIERTVEAEKTTNVPHILKDVSSPVANKTSAPLSTPVTHWELPMEYTPITAKDGIKPFDEKIPKGMSSKAAEEPQKSSLLPTKVSNLPSTQRAVEVEQTTSVPHIIQEVSIPVANKTSAPLSTPVTYWELPIEYTPITAKDGIKHFDEKIPKGMSSRTSEKPQKSSLLPTRGSNLPSTERAVAVEKTTSASHILKEVSIPAANKTSTPLSTPVAHWELPMEYTPITAEDGTKVFAEKSPKGMSLNPSEKAQKSSLLPTKVSNLPSTERTVKVEKTTSIPQILKSTSVSDASKTATPLSTSVTLWELPMEYIPITAKDDTKTFAKKTPKGMSLKTAEEPQKSSLLPTKVSNLPSTERAVDVEKTTSVPHILKDISIPVANKTSTPFLASVTHWELPLKYTPTTAKDDTKAFVEKTPKGMSSKTYEKPQRSSLLPSKISNLTGTERTIEVEKTTNIPHILKDIPVANKASTPVTHWELPMEYTPITAKHGINPFDEKSPKGMSSKASEESQKSSLLPTKVSNLSSTERAVEVEQTMSVPHIIQHVSVPVANKTSAPLSTPVTYWELPMEYTRITAKDGIKPFDEKTPKGMSSKTSEKPQKSSLLPTKVSSLPSTERAVEVEKTTSVPHILKDVSSLVANQASTLSSTTVTHWELPMEYTRITAKDGIKPFDEKTPKGMSSKTSEKPQKSSLLPTKGSNLPSTERAVEVEKTASVPHILKDVSSLVANKASTPLTTTVTHWELPMEYTPITAKDDTKAFAEKTPKGMSSNTYEKPQKSSLLPTKVSSLPGTERAVEVEKTTSVPHILKDISIPVANKTSTPLSTPVTHWELPLEYIPTTAKDDTKAFAEKSPKGMSLNPSEKLQKSSLLPTKVSNLPGTERTAKVEKTTSIPQILKNTSVSDARKTATPLSTSVTHWELPMKYTPITVKDSIKDFAKKTPKGMSLKTSEEPQKSSLLPTKVSNLPSTERAVEVEKTTSVPHILKDISIPVANKTSTPLSTPVTHWELPLEYIPTTAKDDIKAFAEKTPKGMSSKTYEKPQKSSLLPTKVSNLTSTERTIEVEKTTSVSHILKDISSPVANKASTPLSTTVTHWELPMGYTPITAKDDTKTFAEKTPKGMSSKTYEKPKKSSLLPTKISNLPSTESAVEVEKTTSVSETVNDTSFPVLNKTLAPLSKPVTHWKLPFEHTTITATNDTQAVPPKIPQWTSSETSENPQKSSLLPTNVYNLLSTERIVEVEEATGIPETVNGTSFPILYKTLTPLSKQVTHWDLPVDHTLIPSDDGTHVFPPNKPKWTSLKTSEKPQEPSLLPTKFYNLPSTKRTVDVGKTTSVPHILKDVSIPVVSEKYDNLLNLPSTENVGEVEGTREPQTVNHISIPVSNKTIMPISTSVLPWELSSDHAQVTKKDDALVPTKEKPNWMLAKTSENPQKSSVLPTKISNLLSTDQIVSEEESTRKPQTVNDISIHVSNKTLMPLSTSALPWELSTDHPPVTKKDDTLVPPKEKPNWILAKTSEEPKKSVQNVIEEGDTTASHPITDNYQVNNTLLHVLHETSTSLSTPIQSLPTESTTNQPEFITHYDKFIVTNGQIGILSLSPEHDNVMTTEQSFIATDTPVVKSTETDLETKTNSPSVSVAISTFNTPATKRLRSGGISILKAVTLPSMKYPPTKIMKHKDYSIPKEKDQFVETPLKTSTTERVRPATTINVKEDSTANKFEYNSPTGLRITLPSTRFLEDSSETDVLPISKQENKTKSFTTSLDQINLKSIKPLLSQTKTSRRPVGDNNISRQTSSVYLPNKSFSTSAYDLELDRTVDTFSKSPQSYSTDREDVSHAKETTVNDVKIVEKEHIPTEISIISSQNNITEDYAKDTSKQLIDEFETTTAVVSSQSAPKTELFSYSPRNYTSDHVPYQSKEITKPPQKQNTLTHFYSSDDDTSLTTTDNIKDRTSYIEPDSNTPRSAITNIDFDTFYGSTREGSSRDFIKSDNLIEQSSSIPKHIIFKSSTRTDSQTSSTLYNLRSSTEPSGITGHVGASKSFSKISSTSLSDEMLTTKSDLGKPMHPTENVDSTDTYFSRGVNVSDNLPSQFGITTVGKPLLDERVSTKLSEEKLTNTSPKLVSSYVILPESMPSYPESFGKPIVYSPEKMKSNVYLTSSQAPSSIKYVSLKPTHKPYSRMPSVHHRRPHFTEGFASTDSLLDQFRASTTTVKYPSEMFPTRNEGSTTSDTLFMSPHQNTPKDRDFEHNLHSKSPGIQFKYTTPAESFTSDKLLDDYQPTSNHKPYSGLLVINPTSESSITDNKLSDKLVDMFFSTISPSLTQQTVPVAHKRPYSTFSTQIFTSSEIPEHYNRTIKDKQLKQEVSSELPSKHATSYTVSSWLFHKDSNNTTPEVSVLSTESSPLNSPWPTNKQEQYIPHINLQTPSKHTNKTVLMEYSTTSDTLTEEFEGTTELLESKPTSKIQRTTENLIEGDLFSSHTSLSHPSDRYSSAEMTSVAPLLGQSQSSPKIQEEKYLASSSSTTSDTLTDPLTTITNMLPMFSTIHPSVGYQKKPIIPSKNLNAYEDADESVSDSTKTTYSDGDVATSTRSSTEKFTHILKSLDKPICSNAKQKISVRVKILMEHILEKNESGTIKKQVIPIMGIVKRTEFDIKPKKRLPVVPQKKLNQDWNVFLDDLATNFFDFNRAAVKDYSELKPTSLNLNVPGYGFGGDILAPKENIQRMQQIRNWMNPCRRTHGNKASRGVSSSQYIMDENSTPFRIKYAAENLNNEMNLKLTTRSQEQLSTDFYRFLLGSSSGRSQSEVDNKPTKVGIPTKLMLPFNERSRINMVKELRNWPRKPNVVLRTLPYMTPVPGSYRTGYNQFSLSDLFPISSISERNKYIPTIVYRGPTQVGSELFPSYSSASNNRGYNGLPSYSPRLLIDVGPTGEEYRPGVYRNSFETSATSLNPNNAADKEIATVKSLKLGQKPVNENLNKTQINTTNVVKNNKENLQFKLGKGANNVKKDTNNSRSETSHKINLNGNPNTLKSENVNLHPTPENDKSQQSTQSTFIDFRSVLDGIINKLNAVLEKLTKR